MSAPIPSVPSATRSPNRRTGARPTALFMFDRALWANVAPASRAIAISASDRCTPWASSVCSSSAPARASRSTTGIPNRVRQSSSSATSSATWTWRPVPPERAASAHAASVPSDSVNDAWAPTIERASGCAPAATRAPKRRFSVTPAAARSGPSRSVTS